MAFDELSSCIAKVRGGLVKGEINPYVVYVNGKEKERYVVIRATVDCAYSLTIDERKTENVNQNSEPSNT